MAQVIVTAHRVVHAPVDRVRAALADYRDVRPRILTEHYRDYTLRAGGQGPGTEVAWTLAATSKRSRDQLVEVSEDPGADPAALVERDRNSSMVTRWTVTPADGGASTVAVHTSWDGAGGIGGIFEKIFAPAGLRKIYDGVLGRLDSELGSTGG